VPETGGFTPQSKIRDVLARLANRGRELLFEHGYDVGEGFVDVLSQYQTLQHAAETERLRDLEGLLAELNSTR
jgi:basic membrane lipoprotein Med (substrate-binding protein (PBP1-ABC) superfamily)